jgi:protein-tyrosine phosphatase
MSRNVLAPIDSRYGSYRGLVRLMLSFGEVYAGDLRRLRRVRPADARRLVFVCQGNVCRSPFAAAYARSRGLEAASFGIPAP